MRRALFAHPISKALLFSLIPLSYYLLDALNYAQAGKSGLLGFFVLTPLFYWQALYPQHKGLRTGLMGSTFIILAFMIFQASLREIFGVEQDSVVVIEALFNTNVSESQEFFLQYRYALIKHVSLLVVLTTIYPFIVLKLLKTEGSPFTPHFKKSFHFGCWAFTFLAVLVHFNPTLRKANPIFFFPSYYLQWANEVALTKTLTNQIEKFASTGLSTLKLTGEHKHRTVVWVIGESDTRHNWGLYGYPRDTTPELSNQKQNLIRFDHVRAADGGTVGSITKMLTPASQAAPDLWKTQPDVLAMAKHVGYKTFWLSNQATDTRGVLSIFAQHADQTVYTNEGTARGEGTLDEALFAPLEQALADPAPLKFIVVHIMGEHPAYNFRYPESFAKFDGVFDDEVAKGLEAAGRSFYATTFRNQYDNAVTYKDYVLAGLLTRTQAYEGHDAAWVYIADHGQDVSHHSDFSGHNRKVAEMWDVPMLAWFSNGFFTHAVRPKVDTPFQADHINHSILGLLHIQGDYYNPALDIFQPDPQR